MFFFTSFNGQYNDNPKYISIELHKRFPTSKIYWNISNKSKKNDIPDYIHCLRPNSFGYYWIKNRCKFVIENSAGLYIFHDRNKHTLKKLLINKRQFDISTWHGFPVKSIGAQMPENSDWTKDTLFTSSSIMLAGSERIKQVFDKSYLGKLNVVLTGSPRNDILFKLDDHLKTEIKRKLGFPVDKRVMLYVPTFRFSVDDSGINQMNMIDFDVMFNTLSSKFGGDWIFVFRAHNLVMLKIDAKTIKEIDSRIYSGNEYDDMAEYLAIADAVMTDYSGCIFDVLLTNKPCFLFTHDYEHYMNAERGLETSLDILPYSHSLTFEQLIDNIMLFEQETMDQQRVALLEEFGNVDDGTASKKVIDIIQNIKETE